MHFETSINLVRTRLALSLLSLFILSLTTAAQGTAAVTQSTTETEDRCRCLQELLAQEIDWTDEAAALHRQVLVSMRQDTTIAFCIHTANPKLSSLGASSLDSLLRTIREETPPAVTNNSRVRSGFRILVYSGMATRDSRQQAAATAEKVRSLFPEMGAYTLFVSPRWLCVAGNFLTHEEAREALEKMYRTGIVGASIVRSQVLARPN